MNIDGLPCPYALHLAVYSVYCPCIGDASEVPARVVEPREPAALDILLSKVLLPGLGRITYLGWICELRNEEGAPGQAERKAEA